MCWPKFGENHDTPNSGVDNSRGHSCCGCCLDEIHAPTHDDGMAELGCQLGGKTEVRSTLTPLHDNYFSVHMAAYDYRCAPHHMAKEPTSKQRKNTTLCTPEQAGSIKQKLNPPLDSLSVNFVQNLVVLGTASHSNRNAQPPLALCRRGRGEQLSRPPNCLPFRT